jgi:ATP-dependent DNA helicase RecQ
VTPKKKREPPSWSSIRRLAREQFGVTSFLPGQRELIRAALDGRNALGILPTGGGKSLCFQLPAQLLPGSTVVVSPLLALIQDQTDKLGESGVAATKLDSTLKADEERDAISQIQRGESIVYVTPERLDRPEVLELLGRTGVSLLVVDEAHCVSQWGHDFRPAYLSIRDAAKRLGRPPMLALTATATPEVADDVLAQLGMKNAEIVRTDTERRNLFLEVRRTPNEDTKQAALLAVLREAEGSAIVYAATIAAAVEVESWLRSHDIDVTLYHGKMKIADRKASQEAFMTGKTRVVVATSAFGLGIDKPDVRMVVHYNFPDSLESYYQEAGRAGRDGAPARAVLLYRLEDRRVQAYFLGGKYPKRKDLLAVHEAIRSFGGDATLAAIRESTALAEKRVRVILAELDAMGIARRSPGRVRLVRTFADDAELDRFATSYEARFETDQDKLDAMMRYAQSTACRARILADYFGESREEDCNHCDNCRDHPAEHAGTRDAHSPDASSPAPGGAGFHAGDTVQHRLFGRGQVTEVTSEHVRVNFEQFGEKAVSAGHLSD